MSNTNEPSRNHCVHVIGIGRTGGVYIEALLRTGEVEDNLVPEGASLAALLIDIGDDDVQIPNDYARSMKSRMAQRNIPADRYHYEFFNLDLPGKGDFSKKLDAVRAPFEAAGGTNLISKLPADFELPKRGRHVPRAVAKAAAAFGLYLDDRPLAGALERFAETVKKCSHDSTVFVAFGLAGGVGSGIAQDVARELKKKGLGARVKIVGVAQLSHSGDGDYDASAAQTISIEEIDRVTSGAADKNPFPGGCFVVSTEHSWRRLTAYTSTGVKQVRQHFKQLVTNRFVSDSFMRWALEDGSSHLTRVLGGNAAGKCMMFNVAKLSHPGVQVLPGEARSRWDSVLLQWVGFIPEYSGLVDGYSAESVDAHVYGARNMNSGLVDDEIKGLMAAKYLASGNGSYRSYYKEFFDELTAYANIIFPTLRMEDLTAYKVGKEKLKSLDQASVALETA